QRFLQADLAAFDVAEDLLQLAQGLLKALRRRLVRRFAGHRNASIPTTASVSKLTADTSQLAWPSPARPVSIRGQRRHVGRVRGVGRSPNLLSAPFPDVPRQGGNHAPHPPNARLGYRPYRIA